MQYTDKDISIITQVAVKAAVDLYGRVDGDLISIARHVRGVIVRLANEPLEGPPVAVAAAAAPAVLAQQAVAPVATDFAAEIAAADATQAAVTEAFPGAQPVLASQPPFPSDTKDKSQKAANKEWAMVLLQHDQSQFWDNRADKAAGQKSGSYPDFKHKDSGVGVWLD